MPDRTCAECGASLAGRPPKTRFCGSTCRCRAHRAGRAAQSPSRACIGCGNQFASAGVEGFCTAMCRRGYGRDHQRVRREGIASAYGTPCVLCGTTMQPGQQLHLDHTPDRTAYRGFAHADCNTRDGRQRRGGREVAGASTSNLPGLQDQPGGQGPPGTVLLGRV